MAWKKLTLLVAVLELLTIYFQLAVPYFEGRMHWDPEFPYVIVMHGSVPNSDILIYRGSLYLYFGVSLFFWVALVFGVAIVSRMDALLRKRFPNNWY
jgi:hypothetical protein